MEYTLEQVYEYILELLDKKGSDFVQLPDVLRVFKTSTLDFVGERVPKVETTGQITTDLQPLMKTSKENVVPDLVYTNARNMAIPAVVSNLLRVNPIYPDGLTARRPRLIRHATYDSLRTDPHNTPTAEYPLILQLADIVQIHSGSVEKAIGAYVTYLVKPTFASETAFGTRIVNLDDNAIEAIILKTVSSLSDISVNASVQLNNQKEKSFRDPRL